MHGAPVGIVRKFGHLSLGPISERNLTGQPSPTEAGLIWTMCVVCIVSNFLILCPGLVRLRKRRAQFPLHKGGRKALGPVGMEMSGSGVTGAAGTSNYRAWLPPDACLCHRNHQQPEPFLLWQCCARADLPLVCHQEGCPGPSRAAP